MLTSTDQRDDQPEWIKEHLKKKQTLYRPVNAVQRSRVVTTREPCKSFQRHVVSHSGNASVEYQSAHLKGKWSIPSAISPPLSMKPPPPSFDSCTADGRIKDSVGDSGSSVVVSTRKSSHSSPRHVKHTVNRSHSSRKLKPSVRISDSKINMGHAEARKIKSTREPTNIRTRYEAPSVSSPHTSVPEEKELEWGPGIVNKLKSKFIRETCDGYTQGNPDKNMTSNKMDSSELPQKLVHSSDTQESQDGLYEDKRSETLTSHCSINEISKGTVTLSRETGLSIQRNHNHKKPPTLKRLTSLPEHLPNSLLINERIVIVEHPKHTVKPSVPREERRNSTGGPNHEDCPSHDTVRTCKLVFETPNKNSQQQTKLRRKPLAVKTRKVKQTTPSGGSVLLNTSPTIQMQNYLVVKPVTKQENNAYITRPSQRSGLSRTRLVKLESSTSGVTTKFKAKSTFTRSRSVSCDDEKLINEDTKENDTIVLPTFIKSSEEPVDDIKIISSDALERIRSHGSTMIFGGKSSSYVKSRTKADPRTISKSRRPPPPPVCKQNLLPDSKPPASSPMTTNSNTKFLVSNVYTTPKPQLRVPLKPQENRPLVVENKGKIDEFNGLPEEVKDENLTSDVTKAPDITQNQKEEKNGDIQEREILQQVGKSIDVEESEILRPSTLLGNKVPLWQKPPPANNTIVFDFRGKNVQANISLQPKPFGISSGSVVRKKKLTVKSSLPNADVSELREGPDHEDEDYDSRSEDLPVPSELIFIGENTKVGKSAFLVTKNKKLKIQFDEEPTTFTYPSETFLLSQMLNEHENIPGTNLTTKSAMQLTSTLANGETDTFSSYVPSTINTSDKFQLGVSRPSRRLPPTPNSKDQLPTPVDDGLKTAFADEVSSWSMSSSTSDLLF